MGHCTGSECWVDQEMNIFEEFNSMLWWLWSINCEELICVVYLALTVVVQFIWPRQEFTTLTNTVWITDFYFVSTCSGCFGHEIISSYCNKYNSFHLKLCVLGSVSYVDNDCVCRVRPKVYMNMILQWETTTRHSILIHWYLLLLLHAENSVHGQTIYILIEQMKVLKSNTMK